jgi:hypothetical protein
LRCAFMFMVGHNVAEDWHHQKRLRFTAGF